MVCLRPLNCCGQLRASRPPPRQHRVPMREGSVAYRNLGPLEARDHLPCLVITVSPALGLARSKPLLAWSPFSLAATAASHEPLYVIATYGGHRHSAVTRLGMLVTPGSFRPNQSPLGAFHPAPGSHFRRSRPSPDRSFDGSGGVRLSSDFADSRTHSVSPHGTPSPDLGQVAVP